MGHIDIMTTDFQQSHAHPSCIHVVIRDQHLQIWSRPYRVIDIITIMGSVFGLLRHALLHAACSWDPTRRACRMSEL